MLFGAVTPGSAPAFIDTSPRLQSAYRITTTPRSYTVHPRASLAHSHRLCILRHRISRFRRWGVRSSGVNERDHLHSTKRKPLPLLSPPSPVPHRPAYPPNGDHSLQHPTFVASRSHPTRDDPLHGLRYFPTNDARETAKIVI